MTILDQYEVCPIPTIAVGDGTGCAAEIHARLREDGFAVLSQLIPGAHAGGFRDLVDRLNFTPPRDMVYQGQDLLSTICARDPGFLPLLDPSPIIETAELALGDDCHVINQKAWRAHPGHVAGALHVDQLVVPMDEGLAEDLRWEPPMYILSALVYLNDIDQELCPTLVVPGSHRSGRAPRAGESHWRGRGPEAILCRSGDAVIFRSDLWHCGTINRSSDRCRYVIETVYGRRFMAQKFWPYLNVRFGDDILSRASARQRRLLGEHSISNYG